MIGSLSKPTTAIAGSAVHQAAERAGRLYALAERGYRQVGYRLWRTDAEEHRQFDTELRAALGDPVLGGARPGAHYRPGFGPLTTSSSDPAAQALWHRISRVAADR